MASGILIKKSDLKRAVKLHGGHFNIEEGGIPIDVMVNSMFEELSKACSNQFDKPPAPKWIQGGVSRFGPSSDGRSTRWKITCLECRKNFEKGETMLAVRRVTCEYCLAEMLVDFNDFKLKKLEG